MPAIACCSARLAVQTTAQQRHQQRQAAPIQRPDSRRALLVGLGAAAAALAVPSARPPPAAATGLESIDLPPIEMPEAIQQMKKRNQQVLDEAQASFENSDLLRTLKERSDANRDARKKELAERYCYRQAEQGVGDCSGLRLIPGMTKSGVQKRPDWLNNLFGLESE